MRDHLAPGIEFEKREGTMDSLDSVHILLDRLRTGDDAARNELFAKTYDQLLRLAGTIFQTDFPRLLRSHDAESILHQALPRLIRALAELGPVAPRDYFRIAAQHMRWVLLDLARRRREVLLYPSPPDEAGTGSKVNPVDAGDTTFDPVGLAEWAELHRQIEQLPEKEREVTELLWYHGLTQAEAARLLDVSERTVKSRWREARMKLGQFLRGEPPVR
jgi:RNA polymerase sigma-70 factor (ECF subfamily)